MQYRALVVVSPCQVEVKQQDAAQWYPREQVACVCDGVSASPHAAEAALYISSNMQHAFNGDLLNQVQHFCHELQKRRRHTMAKPIKYRVGVSPAMQERLSDVIQKKRANSYQTTVVAIKLMTGAALIKVHLFLCGDSGFFVFSQDGECAFLSISNERISVPAKSIKKELPTFQPVENREVRGAKTAKLVLGDFMESLVPVSPPAPPPKASSPKAQTHYLFLHESSSTHVLPDSFLSGQYQYKRLSFPAGSHFLLATDGLYDGFKGSRELFDWLRNNWAALQDSRQREKVMQERHQLLMDNKGDDDISFIWLYPENYRGKNCRGK